jgi:hypothetical protein
MADSVLLYHLAHPAVEQDVAGEEDGERIGDAGVGWYGGARMA